MQRRTQILDSTTATSPGKIENMALPADFIFSKIPAVQAEGERRAVIMFGADWKQVCDLDDAWGLIDTDEVDGEYIIVTHHPKQLIKTVDYDAKGRPVQLESTERDCPCDLEDGSPAIVSYHLDGQLAFAAHYFYDTPEDTEDGVPAIVRYHPNGQIAFVAHYREDDLWDAADGTPGRIDYAEDGTVIGGQSAVKGDLTAEETVKMIKAAEVFRAAAVLAGVDKTVMPSGQPLP